MPKYEIDITDLSELINEQIKDDSIPDFNDILSLEVNLEREIYIGDIEYGLGKEVDTMIRFWNRQDEKQQIPVEDRKPIKLYIDSNGGNLTDTFTIIDSIQLSKTPVFTIVSGTAYSGGFFIAIAGHKRYAYPLASYLYHEGSTGNAADAGKFRNFADFYEKQLDLLKEITLGFTTMTEEYYDEHQRDDLWLMAEEALELGVVDEILNWQEVSDANDN